jgi:hypothetical protein
MFQKSVTNSKNIQKNQRNGATTLSTTTQTDTRPPVHLRLGKDFNALFDTFHFIIFALLTPFKKAKT